ncbi:ATP-dependent RecD-like DNA helicase [Pleurocapsa sp. PCC 7319]|uniref:SF1B family DNA helicase RecD2 n=1 Tax=Pleurocapsa sp. PCC 7319 TaxID=118161 RepID=UPI000349E981|nr:ATP-dependent RecD-like DNA helicase [Pleurocapsa sp. PCC 7319]
MTSSTVVSAPLSSLTGVIERITFHSSESGYTVARLNTGNVKQLLTIVGSFANIQAGQTLQLQGLWREHPQYGSQFQVVQYQETKPATLTGIEKYLGSGLIKGVGPVTAKRIVKHFGLDTLEIIENQIDRLSEVPGIANKRIAMIQSTWSEQKSIKEVMIFLSGHGVSTTYAVKIYKQYGDDAITTVTTNPYQLALDIFGIGFLTADKIACNVGVAPDSLFRYRAGILHVLNKASEDGHCYLPESQIVPFTKELLTTDEYEAESRVIVDILSQMVIEEQLIREKDDDELHGHLTVLNSIQHPCPLYYQPSFFYSEQHLAKLLQQKLETNLDVDRNRVKSWIGKFTASKQIKLSPQQYVAVEMAAREKVMILTGGPGTGKTFVTRTIVKLWKAMGKSIACAAPTGRAAKRLTEMTGISAKTLHRLLEFDPSQMGFKRDGDHQLDCSAIVVDESSMVDLFMAHSLLKAIPKNALLLMVGDIDQLPSVGPGNVLKDLIGSDKIPVVRLTQVFRQAAESAIITTAHQINRGSYPQLEKISMKSTADCLWHPGGTEAEHGVQTICELIEHYIPHAGFNPATDVQVLSPMTRGVVGTRNLNKVLQQLINPPDLHQEELARGDSILRIGDRVMQLKNDYTREVFNGDLGIVINIDHTEKEVTINFDEREVVYDFADLNEITLAWATSIHKSQGSEYPVVILPLYTQHYVMLSRNLFYTGLTRAKKLALIVGSQKAIAIAVKQVKQQQRYTKLKERLEI